MSQIGTQTLGGHMREHDTAASRRRFLKYVMASPLLPLGLRDAHAQQGEAAFKFEDPMQWAPIDTGRLVSAANQAQNVFDLEVVAHNNVPPAHWGYLTTGAESESTLRANFPAQWDPKLGIHVT